jgi:preprotein translocase subunit SecE
MATQAGKLKNEETQSRSASFEVPGFLSKLGEYPRRWRAFLHEVRVEMRQVTWPTRHEVFVTTWVVIVTVAFFGFFFFGVDSSASWIVQHIIRLFRP